jgi:uncharacterized membrane protein YphA (DoxX/SURF4 family)
MLAYTAIPLLGIAALMAIVFLQSGIDKIVDRPGNLAWMEPHFANSPLKGQVPILLSIITFFELATGLACLAGMVLLFVQRSTIPLFWAMTLAMATFLQLFFGQRMAKDYPGAASLVPYFLTVIAGLVLSYPVAEPLLR